MFIEALHHPCYILLTSSHTEFWQRVMFARAREISLWATDKSLSSQTQCRDQTQFRYVDSICVIKTGFDIKQAGRRTGGDAHMAQ